ncbi:hypothetical protein PO909_030272 [Leuciscus waleckii]
MPATPTYSHAPTMSTHASPSATPSLVPKCTSPGHAESVSPASGDPYPAPPQDHYTSQPQSNIPEEKLVKGYGHSIILFAYFLMQLFSAKIKRDLLTVRQLCLAGMGL